MQLTKTFSLARLAPAEFQRFRETGVMTFATPMGLFDRDFPGHYLRLVKRVRTSVIALIPPTDGIHATLTTAGLSRAVIGGDIFQKVIVRRSPESVALTAPMNATGLFELTPERQEMLLPFESIGVDTTWEFRMPKASNQFDYSSVADVLITLEYTALHSYDHQQQVIQELDRSFSADRPFSFRHEFADQWYDLNNPEVLDEPDQMIVRFRTERADFPPNIEELRLQQVVLYFSRGDEAGFEVPATLRLRGSDTDPWVGGSAQSIDGIISTRRGNAASWLGMLDGRPPRPPIGEWELNLRAALDDGRPVAQVLKNEDIEDILFVITYSGRTPPWPA
jgi:hypothetical protein